MEFSENTRREILKGLSRGDLEGELERRKHFRYHLQITGCTNDVFLHSGTTGCITVGLAPSEDRLGRRVVLNGAERDKLQGFLREFLEFHSS